jgi:hypothetical protein
MIYLKTSTEGSVVKIPVIIALNKEDHEEIALFSCGDIMKPIPILIHKEQRG